MTSTKTATRGESGERNAAPLFARRLQLVTGKGGVGKTTVVAALAVEAARAGRLPLIVEMGHRASLEGVFETGPIGYVPSMVAPGVHAMNLDMDSALLDYVTSHVLLRGLARRLLASAPIRAFSNAAPAVMEMATLDKLRALLAERMPKGHAMGPGPRWDPILVDLDATGHALMFLDLPKALEGLAATGPLATLLTRLTALLSDATTTALHLVTLPTPLPLHETVELHARLRATHHVPLGALIVNRLPPSPVSHEDRGRLLELEARARHLGMASLAADLALAQRAEHAQANARHRIDEVRARIGLRIIELDDVPLADGPTLASLASLGTLLARGMTEAPW